MSVTVIREGNVLRIVEASGEIPEGIRLVLLMPEEQARLQGFTPLEYVQLESVFAEDEEDWTATLDALEAKASQAQ